MCYNGNHDKKELAMNSMTNRILKAKIIEIYGSQYGFAKEIGVHESYISYVVNNKRMLAEKEMQRWAKKLKCEARDIFNVNNQTILTKQL